MSTPNQWRALALLSIAELFGMALWFSGSAVVPALSHEWNLSGSQVSWLANAVQLGFVAGTLISATLNLADIITTRHLFAVLRVLGALTNAFFGLYAHSARNSDRASLCHGCLSGGRLSARNETDGDVVSRTAWHGARCFSRRADAGQSDALSRQCARQCKLAPECAVRFIARGRRRVIVLLFVSDGPYALPPATFDLTQIVKVFRNRGVRLASFGYFGHMWELYAMWIWIPVMIRASVTAQSGNPILAEVGSFLVIGAGAIGCVVAGLIADRVGRTVVTSWAMAISGSCCLLVGFFYGGSAWPLLLLAAIWGASVVADSAQFSSCVTELGDPQYIGTALTLQMCIGFLLTTVSIELIPKVVEVVTWRYAFMILAPGPFLGVLAMLRLRGLPEALKIAHGRR